ncbi:MAG: sigma-70 family RNA polymerase sigma factor [Bacteroidota bacterium]|nr:sigma-70 family RNA polymerase sigma factor [Bacteroidota bacterium]
MLYPERYKDFTDKELIAEYKKSTDKIYVGILYKRYSHLVMGLSMKYLKDEDNAKDAVINIFTKLFDDLLKHNVEYFKSWLYTFTKNHCLMKLRSEQSKLRKNLDYEYDVKLFVEKSEEMHQNANKREQEYVALERAMAGLNEEQRICVELFYMKDKSYNEIVEITGYSLNNVKSYIQNGKRNLKIKLETQGGQE